MLFNSYIFILLFLPLTLSIFFVLNKLKLYTLAKTSLVIASLVFYGYNNPYYLFVILSSIVINFAFYKLMRKYSCAKRWFLIFGVISNVAVLGYFKYFDFLLENINYLTGSSFSYFNIALPLGISFFTFQQISFLVDSYRGECYCDNFIDYILFVTFFPQLVAGPIVSHDEMIPQFMDTENKHLNYDNLARGIKAFTIGLFKKVIIADSFGRIVTHGYSFTSVLNSFEALLTIISYTIQIYFDFSGYCDMASGISWMFNINLPVNFNSPYKATTIVDFWKRWHITLTRFLTKYVYIPLGGNRCGEFRTYIHILCVFLISGIWHGAGYTFILWGALHGIANVLCRLFDKQIAKIPRLVNWGITFLFLNFTWIIFRAESIDQAMLLISRIFAGGISVGEELRYTLTQMMLVDIPYQFLPLSVTLVGYIGLIMLGTVFGKNTAQLAKTNACNKRTIFGYSLLFMVSLLSLSGVSTFLYFNF